MKNTNEEITMTKDELCIHILSNKMVLAYILKNCVQEYADCSAEDIVRLYLSDDIELNDEFVHQDANYRFMENSDTEDKTMDEGNIRYDIKFTAKAPYNNKLIQLVINVEAQNNFEPGYSLLKRGIYYCSRLISSQKGKKFIKTEYGKIIKVYSVWVCFNPLQRYENTITEFSMKQSDLYGKAYYNKEDYDLTTLVMVCLGEKPNQELLNFLCTLFKERLSVAERKEILEKEYGFEFNSELEKELRDMTVLERERTEGRIEGRT